MSLLHGKKFTKRSLAFLKIFGRKQENKKLHNKIKKKYLIHFFTEGISKDFLILTHAHFFFPLVLERKGERETSM